jgi:asparagine synthase (glutamine-hydrolysing)
VSGGWTKRLLRETYKNLLPEKICWRKDKVGFEAPQSDWLNTPFAQELVRQSQAQLEQAGITERGKQFDGWHSIMTAKLLK